MKVMDETWRLDDDMTAMIAPNTVKVFSAYCEDNDGKVWQGMAYLVAAFGHDNKTFIGETAWSDAQRHAMDIALREMYKV